MSGRAPTKIGRQAVSYLLDPSTIARLTSLSDTSGMSRGKIIDRAVERLTACRACAGTGKRAPVTKGADPEWAWTPCPKCTGSGFVV